MCLKRLKWGTVEAHAVLFYILDLCSVLSCRVEAAYGSSRPSWFLPRPSLSLHHFSHAQLPLEGAAPQSLYYVALLYLPEPKIHTLPLSPSLIKYTASQSQACLSPTITLSGVCGPRLSTRT